MFIDLELPSEDHQKDMEDGRPCLSRIVEDSEGEVHNGDGATVSSQRLAEHDEEYTERTPSGGTSNSKHKKHSGNRYVDSDKGLEPRDSMEFDSKDDAFSFYKEYVKSVGFATITKASHRSRISGKFIDGKFVCTRYGKRRESSTCENFAGVRCKWHGKHSYQFKMM